jgi:hypothetical protein
MALARKLIGSSTSIVVNTDNDIRGVAKNVELFRTKVFAQANEGGIALEIVVRHDIVVRSGRSYSYKGKP